MAVATMSMVLSLAIGYYSFKMLYGLEELVLKEIIHKETSTKKDYDLAVKKHIEQLAKIQPGNV